MNSGVSDITSVSLPCNPHSIEVLTPQANARPRTANRGGEGNEEEIRKWLGTEFSVGD